MQFFLLICCHTCVCTTLDFIILYAQNKFETKYRLLPKARCFEGLTSTT